MALMGEIKYMFVFEISCSHKGVWIRIGTLFLYESFYDYAVTAQYFNQCR